MKSRRFAAEALAVIGLMVSGAAVRGNVAYVTDYSAGTIQRVPDGGGASTVFASGLTKPEGITFTPSGTMYVDEQFTNVISSVSSAGVVTPFVTIPGTVGIGGLTCDAAGNLYVSLETTGVVDKVTPAGGISPYATGMGSPQQLAFDSTGHLFAGNATGTIEKVPIGGGAGATFATFAGAAGIAIDAANNIYATSATTGKLEQFSSTGTDLGLYSPTPGIYEGLAFDAAGNLLAGNAGSTVYAVPAGGGAATTYGTGFGASLFIAIDPTPEPASLGLLAIGGVALLGRRRRASV